MKPRILLAILCAYIVGCTQEQTHRPSETNLTESIGKIETSYYEGADKYEGKTNAAKLETLLSEAESVKFFEKLDRKLAANLPKAERYRSARTIFDGYDVGVIPNVDACPSWSEKIVFFMDCEDSGAATRWIDDPNYSVDNYRGSWVVDGNRNLKMVFCRVDGRLFAKTNPELYYGPSAVLRLGTNFVGTGIVQRHFDNEDRNNKNYHIGDIAPNYRDGNTTLFFATLDRIGAAANTFCCHPLPDLGFGYGVVTYSQGGPWGYLNIDDEDSDNANRLLFNGRSVSQISNYLYGGSNTQIFIARAKP